MKWSNHEFLVVRGSLRQGPWPQEERQVDRGGAEDHQRPPLGQLPEEDRRAPQGRRGLPSSCRAVLPGSPLGPHRLPPRPDRPLRRLHPRGQGARLLRPQAQGQEDQVNVHLTFARIKSILESKTVYFIYCRVLDLNFLKYDVTRGQNCVLLKLRQFVGRALSSGILFSRAVMYCLDLIFEMLPGNNLPLDHASKVRSGLRLTTLGQIFRWRRPQNPKVAFTNKFSRKSCNYEFLNARRISRRLPKLTQALFALSGNFARIFATDRHRLADRHFLWAKNQVEQYWAKETKNGWERQWRLSKWVKDEKKV